MRVERVGRVEFVVHVKHVRRRDAFGERLVYVRQRAS